MTLRNILWALACLSFLLLAGCGGGESNIKSGTTKVVASTGDAMPPPDSTSTGGVYTGVSDYRIGPQDLIEISVFQIPDLSRTVRVNSSGQISLPLIGVLQAGGQTVQELEKTIATRLEAKYLQNPQVTAFVKEYTSQRITVEGAVTKPGIYPIQGRTSLLQAIAMAEGVNSLANLQGIVIFRQVSGKKMGARFDLKAIRNGDAEDPVLYGDDVIVVDQSGSKTALRRFLEAMPILNVFTLL
jgi:polysaccharide export outer membrane protein